jgi:hypothetical protein
MSGIWCIPVAVTCLEFHQPPNGPVSLSEEHLICSAMNPSGEYTQCKENKSLSGLPCSLFILYLTLLCGRELSLLHTLQLHLGFSQILSPNFKYRHKVCQAACILLGFRPHLSHLGIHWQMQDVGTVLARVRRVNESHFLFYNGSFHLFFSCLKYHL